MTKPVFRMSDTGACPRVLTAQLLGNTPLPQSKDDIERLNYYKSLEQIAADKLEADGYPMISGGVCDTCKANGEIREGIHVELHSDLFDLIGHLDRRIIVKSHQRPLEIKSLGRFMFEKFKTQPFKGHEEYKYQEACYLEAEMSSMNGGIYFVLNRDTGDTLRYSINEEFDGFPRIDLDIEYQQIVDKLNEVVIYASSNELAPGKADCDGRYCRYKYLCIKEEPEPEPVKVTPEFEESVKMYFEGLAQEKEGKSKKELGQYGVVNYVIDNRLEKFKASGALVSFRGMRTKKWLDEKTLISLVSQDIIDKARRQSDPYPDITIRALKEKSENVE
jgi:hypothetical protein